MEKIAWGSNIMVGVEIIDSQHKVLIDMMNTIYDYFSEGKEINIRKMETELWDYTQYHFKTEEKLMESIIYPSLGDHLEEHFNFVMEISKIRDDSDDEDDIAMNVVRFLSKWLYDHILSVDKRLGNYVRENNLKINLEN